MFTFNIKDLFTSAPGLTQARFLKLDSAIAHAAASTQDLETRAQPFSSVLMASTSADRFYDVGRGTLDAVAYTRIMEQYAYASGLDFMDLSIKFDEYIMRASRSLPLWINIFTAVLGAAGKNIRRNMKVRLLPAHIHEQVLKAFPTDHPPFALLVADYVAGLVAPLGWVVEGQGYSYHISRRHMFPTADELVHAIRSSKMQNTINILATAKLGVFEELVKDDAVSVVPLAQAVTNALVIASEQAMVELDPYRVVKSVMFKLIHSWNPRAPKEMFPSERVLATPGFEECRNNLSLFLIAQEMLNGPTEPDGIDWMEPFVDYTDEEFCSYVMKYFYEAVLTNSSYQPRRIDEATSAIGNAFACDAQRHPVHLALYEVLKPETNVSVFKPVQTGGSGPSAALRYLMIDSDLSTKYSDALKSASGFFDLRQLVQDRIDSYENLAASARDAMNGLSVSLLLPSIVERETAFNRPLDLLRNAISGASDSDIETGASTVFSAVDVGDGTVAPTARVLTAADHVAGVRRRLRDVYAYVSALAVRADRPSVAAFTRDDGRTLIGLTWTISTSVRKALGQSTILGSIVATSEPLEALAYSLTQHRAEPTGERIVQGPLLELHQDSMHMWNWYAASTPLVYSQTYTTNLGGNAYSVDLNEKHLFGMFAHKKGVRFMRPVVARAAVVTWLELWRSDLEFLRNARRTTKDDLVRAAIDGRLLQTKVDVVARLIALANSPVGARAMSKIDASIRNQMYNAGDLDEYTSLHTIVQRLAMSVNAGIWVIELLGLANKLEVEQLIKEVNDPRVLQLSLALMQGQRK